MKYDLENRGECMVCAFFGHRDCPYSIESALFDVLCCLVEQHGVNEFLVGNHGNFDRIVLSQLRKLKEKYPHICYCVVLAYLPIDKQEERYENTIYPEGMESVPPRFAIVRRNRWIVEQCDIVVSYILYSGGGAAQFVRLAEKKGKYIINLANMGKK